MIYTGTMSKILSPGVRVGWLVAPRPLLAKLILGKQSADLCSSTLAQHFVAAYFASGDWRAYVDSLREIYHRRRDVILDALAEHLPAAAYLHSHMLAVRKQYRNGGLGRRIKLFQREEALRHGFELIEWTFDPLEIKNAYLNIEKLGAIARRYTINQYGITTSPLQGGLPTDRLIAEWWLKSKRVENC